MRNRRRVVETALVVLAVVLAYGCGGSDQRIDVDSTASGDDSEASGDDSEASGDDTEAPGVDSPASGDDESPGGDAAADGEGPSGTDELLAGVGGTCALLERVEPELQARIIESAVDAASFGPLVMVEVDGARVVATTTYDEPGVEGPSAAWRVDGDDLVPIDEVSGRLTGGEVDLVDTAGEDPVARALAEAQDCSWIAADRSAPDPPEPEPQLRPELIVADPSPARPGGAVTLRFPEETFRGIAFQLDRELAGGGWETTHWMTSDANGGDPVTVPVGTDGFAVEDVGVGGPGPDHVLLPDDLAPGSHRICTANAGEEFCTRLEIAS